MIVDFKKSLGEAQAFTMVLELQQVDCNGLAITEYNMYVYDSAKAEYVRNKDCHFDVNKSQAEF